MEYMQEIQPENIKGQILCCECGTAIDPNPTNMCVGCLRTHVDITQDIPKQSTLYFCRGCERYLQPPAEWVHCALESKELMTICLKKLKGLNKVKLIDATFIWTEPHSKRIKIKLTVQAEVIGKAVLQQEFVVEFTVNHQMCDNCHRSEAQDYWRAMVQVRQKSENKKTFFYLEQLILKHKAQENTLGIKPIHEGIDFYYATEGHARKMVEFINSVLPCKYQHSKKLISHDIHSNVYNYKFSYSVEIVPISKDSVVCLPKKLTQQLGGISPICLVYRVTNTVHLIDPANAQIAEINSTIYWRYPFNSICNPRQLTEFIVMDIEPILEKDKKYFPGQGAISTKHVPADAWVVKASDYGIVSDTIHTRTHLGHVLRAGDSVLGYNLQDSNVNDNNFDKLDSKMIPDVILVKKFYPDKKKKQRIWKLKHITMNDENPFQIDRDNRDYDEFLDELEQDPALRQNVHIFKDSTKVIPIDRDDMSEENDGNGITLQEMLDDLVIDDVEMGE
nr:60S ribosomal export protein NMD3 [Onthophagus taurus]